MTENHRARTRRTRLKLILAGVAVAGIGAAITTAAWTDDVWFSADAEAATFDLQGCVVTETTVCDPAVDADWEDIGIDDADSDITDDVAIEVPDTVLAGLVPADSRTAQVAVRNAGTSTIELTVAEPVLTGTIFADPDPATAALSAPATTTLAPEAATTMELTVATGADWPESYIGSTGNVSILVVGTAVVAP